MPPHTAAVSQKLAHSFARAGAGARGGLLRTLAALLSLVACGTPSLDSFPAAAPPTADCIESFVTGRDYFPDKAFPRHALGFRVTYHDYYKILSVGLPGGKEEVFVLQLCGTPEPPLPDGAKRISLPLTSLATTSTTELPFVLALGLENSLLGHDELDFIVSPELRQRAEAGRLREVGSGAKLDLEKVLDVGPELLLVDHPGRLGSGQAERLEEAGVAVVAVPSFLEASPLGRAEWIKVLGYFFDREAEAEIFFSQVEKRYSELVARAAGAQRRPTVLTSAPLSGTWYVPGGQSFLAQLLADAGAAYLWAEDASTGSLALDVEAVIERGADAEIWLHPSDLASLAAIRANDPRLGTISALQEGRVWGNDLRLGPAGGNDYWEQGSARPDLVLADLLGILHPDLMPRHQPYFHRLLPAEEE